MVRRELFELLASETRTSSILGNVLAAVGEGLLERERVRKWAEAALDLHISRGTPPRLAALGAIWADCDQFQRLGPQIETGNAPLLIFSTISRVEYALDTQARAFPVIQNRPRGTAAGLAAFLREQAAYRASFTLFHPQRLAWYARRDGAFSDYLEAIEDGAGIWSNATGAVVLLRYLGLPLTAGEQWMMFEFDLGLLDKTSENALFRPTAFDGIDGMFFKQLSEVASSGWGRTADLAQLGDLPGLGLMDGAYEGVGAPFHVSALISCQPLPLLPHLDQDNDMLQADFSRRLLSQVLPKAADWPDLVIELERAL